VHSRHHYKARGPIRPTADEVATLIVGGEGTEATGHDIILQIVAGNVKRQYGTHPSYMAL